ncbi:AsmA family protein [Planctomycetota bacterium]
MKKPKKIMRNALLTILILVVLVMVLLSVFGGGVIKKGIETVASDTLKVGVAIGDMDFSILRGRIGFQDLVIDNPPGYKHEKLLELGDARISVKIGSLLSDTVEIREIALDNVNIVIEQKSLTTNNLSEIIEALPSEKEATEKQPDKPAKNMHIGNLELTNITVKAKLLPVPGKVDTITIKLDPIIMKDLGRDEKLDTAKLTGKILVAIAKGVSKQGAGVLPDDMVNSMKTALGKTLEFGKTTVEETGKLLKQGKDVGEETLKGIKGLFKSKKKD